jgi:hypothetical protein
MPYPGPFIFWLFRAHILDIEASLTPWIAHRPSYDLSAYLLSYEG